MHVCCKETWRMTRLQAKLQHMALERQSNGPSQPITEIANAPESTRPGPCLLRAIAAVRAACVPVAIFKSAMGSVLRAFALASMPGMDGGGRPSLGGSVVGRALALASMPGMEGGGGPSAGGGVGRALALASMPVMDGGGIAAVSTGAIW